MLIKGKWAKDFHPVQDTDEEGGFVREDAGFRHWITPMAVPAPPAAQSSRPRPIATIYMSP